jgi:hypothetical protein
VTAHFSKRRLSPREHRLFRREVESLRYDVSIEPFARTECHVVLVSPAMEICAGFVALPLGVSSNIIADKPAFIQWPGGLMVRRQISALRNPLKIAGSNPVWVAIFAVHGTSSSFAFLFGRASSSLDGIFSDHKLLFIYYHVVQLDQT